MKDRQRSIILASRSPRRQELLTQIGLSYSTVPSDVDEQVRPREMPQQFALRVARDKALAVSSRITEGVIIAADTIVVLDGAIMGKPCSPAEAAEMLRMLSGQVHEVMTGLVVVDIERRKTLERLAVTKVWFRSLSAEEIDSYVSSGEPHDKAGAYGIQGKGALLVDRIDGCYFNVVGLPLSALGQFLRELQIPL